MPYPRRDRVRAAMASPATLEKELVRTGGPAVLERPETARKQRVEEPRKEKKGMGSEAWEVRIYNDGLNTREHVARSLVQVTGMSEMEAYQTMMQAHLNGLATVGRYIYEVAEMFHDALKKNGIVCDIVPVEED
jgi:ATP-dependent Clp protease adaptor protein ClpS